LLEYFEQAIALDPGYSLAHAGLADSYIMLAYHNYVLQESIRSGGCCDAAVTFDDACEAHTARACVSLFYDWDWLPPSEDFSGRSSSRSCIRPRISGMRAALGAGRSATAWRRRRAPSLAPLSLVGNANLGWALYFARRHDEPSRNAARR